MTGVLREHIEYLTLKGRSQLFEQAIAGTVRDGDVVADLGCGLGVLGMQCLKAGASKVYGIDASDAVHLARESAERAGLQDRYICIPGSTFSADLPQQVDALICDHVGYFGFDYGIIDMLRDASQRMLREGGRIIPDRLALHVAGVSSDNCRDLAAAWTQPEIPEELHWLDEYARNTRYSHDLAARDLCTPAAELGEIDLSSGDETIYAFSAVLTAEQDCRFDGLAGWFSAHLGAGVWMTNSPLDDASIGRSQAFLPVSESFDVRRGDEIAVKLRASSDGKLIFWTVEPPSERGRVQKMSTWASTVLSQRDLEQRAEKPAELTANAKAVTLILSLVDGERTGEEIEQIVLDQLPDFRPTATASREFVQHILARNTRA